MVAFCGDMYSIVIFLNGAWYEEHRETFVGARRRCEEISRECEYERDFFIDVFKRNRDGGIEYLCCRNGILI